MWVHDVANRLQVAIGLSGAKNRIHMRMQRNMMRTFFSNFMKCLAPERAPTEEELLQIYQQMTDQAFRMIVPGDLTPVARKAYDKELMRRNRR
jgi:hypothetical protein